MKSLKKKLTKVVVVAIAMMIMKIVVVNKDG